ncbi:MAG: serine/threonine protein kinase [Planctomycetaceae bacterium]
MSRSLRSTRLLLKRNLWLWPIIAVVLLGLVGFTVRSAIESTMKGNLRSQLTTLLDVEVAMLRTWFEVQQSSAETEANSTETRAITRKLLALAEKTAAPDDETSVETLHRELQLQLGATMSSHRYVGYFIADKSRTILSASDPTLIGRKEIPQYDRLLSRSLDGICTVSPPFRSVSMLKSGNGSYRTGLPTMYVAAPIRDDNFQVMATLAFQIRPEEEFTEILQLGRIGESGETYAFDSHAVMVSNSRFDTDLMLLGLIPQDNDSRSMLSIQVRDPGGNMVEGFRPTNLRAEMQPTRMALSAISHESSTDVEGYRDYRGVPVVGAWSWLADYDIGVATEIDFAEAYRPLTILQWTFWGLFTLLIASSVAIFIFTIIVARLQREAQKAAIDARQVGQYELQEKLGQGAMGVVYKGQHAMLRRPTAIKMLDLDKINDDSISRFEREVQITCQLNNPNTIAIYDYGRTPEGVFYYAMEYLDGIDLESLCRKAGPQPEARVIHLLLQICGSLYEAHSLGLVHRDIKPANIMLNRRGGLPDVIKVLDFGLVKALDSKKQASMTAANSLTGTPLYISPEGVNSPALVDARSDLYAVGAVGYFLLTGMPPFMSENLVELLRMHVMEPPLPPSERTGREVSPELEAALLACLEKSPANRPQTARDLANLLRKCPAFGKWTVEDGDAWWGRYDRGQLSAGTSSMVGQSGATGRFAGDESKSGGSKSGGAKTQTPASARTTPGTQATPPLPPSDPDFGSTMIAPPES